MISAECLSPYWIFKSYLSHRSIPLMCQIILESPTSEYTISMQKYSILFLTTCLIEAPIYWINLKKILKSHIKGIQLILVLNLSTHPIVIWLIPILAINLNWTTLSTIIISEFFAPLIEMLILILWYKINWKKAFITAFLANLISWWLGLFL
jgi:hypothetical protein